MGLTLLAIPLPSVILHMFPDGLGGYRSAVPVTSVNLVGQSLSLSRGTPSLSTGVSRNISGQFMTSVAGQPNTGTHTSVSLSGVSVTPSQGTPTRTVVDSYQLPSSVITSSTGTPTVTTVRFVNVTPTSQALSSDQGIISNGASGTIIFQSTLSSFTGWTSTGSAWSIQSDGGGSFARCAYNGQNTGPYQLSKTLPVNPETGSAPTEYYIAFDMRQSVTSVTSKIMKFFGVGYPSSSYSNNTWNAGYGEIAGVMYGNSPTGGNDATCVQKYRTDIQSSIDTRSAATLNSVFRKGQTLTASTSWRRFFFHWKQNSTSTTADGEVQVYIDSFDGNGKVLWLDVRGLFNRGNDSSGFQSFTVGDYTQTTTPFNFDVRNLVLSYNGMPN